MSTMSDYTIYCTTEQVKKAIELGAPILTKTFISSFGKIETNLTTAEQMIGWLEEQEELNSIEIEYNSDCKGWSYFLCPSDDDDCIYKTSFSSRKEATITAIDMALEYLTKVREA